MPQTFSGDTGASKCDAGSVDTAAIQAGAVTPAKLSQSMTMGTRQLTTSGTTKDFTGIPAWVKRITVTFVGVSASGTSLLQIQLGDSGGVSITGYNGHASYDVTGGSSLTGFLISPRADPAASHHGQMVITLHELATNTWTYASNVNYSGNYTASGSGSKSLSGTLDRIRLTTVNGTDTFDAGSINIMYEG